MLQAGLSKLSRTSILLSPLARLTLCKMPIKRKLSRVTVTATQIDVTEESRSPKGASEVQQTTQEVKQKVKRVRTPKAAKKKDEDPLQPRALNGSPDNQTEGEPSTIVVEVEVKQKVKRQRKPPAPVYPVYHHDMRPAPLTTPALRVLSWNVAGLRALLNKNANAVKELIESQQADVLCLQEIKLQDKHVEEIAAQLDLQHWFLSWNCSQGRLGYSGTALFSRIKPLSIHKGIGRDEHDQEGRVITAEFPNLYIVNTYVPNSGDGLKRLEYRTGEAGWDVQFSAYLKELTKKKPVVVTGDLNCAHKEIDIHAPKRNLRSAGFTQEERDSFSKHLIGGGLVDAFRFQHPEVTGYTYWSWRAKTRATNKGWRLDYFLVSEGFLQQVHDCYHLTDFMGSDHCPLGLIIKTDPAAA